MTPVQIAVGGMHCCALTSDNRILSLGVNDAGALGRDTAWEAPEVDIDAEEEEGDVNPLESVPGEIEIGREEGVVWAGLVAGDNRTFGLTAEGDVWGWGGMRVCFFSLSFWDWTDYGRRMMGGGGRIFCCCGW